MAKFLIQDIIPPEKKHRATHKKTHAKETSKDEGIHNVISHFGETETTPPSHKIAEVNQLMHSKPKEMIPENPRMILEDHIHNDENEGATQDSNEFEKTDTQDIGEEPKRQEISNDVPPPVNFPEYGPGHHIFENESNKWLPWLIGVGILGVLVIIVLNFFGGATITVVPKHEAIPMDQQMTAVKNAQNDELPYVVISETLTENEEVPATGTKTVTEKASGQIIVFNKQTTTQRLIRNTRFQSPTGKIYRINDSINVPKATTKNGETTPGSIVVTVYADEAGPDYNSDPTDFTVPGLKGSPQFDKVYARSKGPITGGASGTLKTVSDQDLKQANDELRIALETKLRTKARADIDSTHVAYDNGIIVELGDAALSKDKASSNDKAVVSEEGTIYVVAFDRTQLSKAIEKILVPTYAGEDVSIKNLDGLTFAMPAQKGQDLLAGDKITFSLKGTPELTWIVDQNVIIKDLLGKAKEDFNRILAKYPTVEQAKATLRPFWKSTFPTDPSKITIKIVDTIDNGGSGK